MDLSNTWHL